MVLAFLKNALFPRHAPLAGYRPIEDGQSPGEHDTLLGLDQSQVGSEKRSNTSSPVTEKRIVFQSYETCRKGIDPRTISDAIIGLSDGLTVPFALTAGLSALGSSRVVVFGGLAELIAGSISMGLGGWLATTSEIDSYHALSASTHRLVRDSPERTAALIRSTFEQHFPSLSRPIAKGSPEIDPTVTRADMVIDAITEHASDSELANFLLSCHHLTSPPSTSRSASTSAFTIAAGYFLGGFIPLVPYFFISKVVLAFWWSVAVMELALFTFGIWRTWFVDDADAGACDVSEVNGDISAEDEFRFGDQPKRRKAWRTTWRLMRGGLVMMAIGSIAAGASVALVKAFQ